MIGIGLIILLCSLQAFASSLNMSVIDLVKQIIGGMSMNYAYQAEQEIDSEKTSQYEDLNNFMADENSRARTLLYDYTQQELENARGQLDSYSNTLKIEVANLIDGEVDKAKQDIALRIANKTNKAIEDIEKEFEKIIKDLNK